MMPPDPLGPVNQLLGTPRAQVPQHVISPQDQESVLAVLGQGAISGMGAVGRFLDKYTGSRAVRGLLAGRPEELLSVIPFSDKLGITDPANVARGKDVTGWDDPNSIVDDIANFGAEVLLDPTLPFTGFLKGGLTGAGKLAKAAGVLKDLDWALEGTGKFAGKLSGRAGTTLGQSLEALTDPIARKVVETKLAQQLGGAIPEHLLAQPLGKSLGVGIPFMEPFAAVNVPGLNKARDIVFGKVRRSAPVRAIFRYLHAPAKEMKTLVGQKIAQQVSHLEARDAEMVEQLLDDALRLTEEGHFNKEGAIKFYRMLEGFDPVEPQYADMVNRFRKIMSEALETDRARGLGAKLNDAYIKHFMPRRGLVRSNKMKEVLDSVANLLTSKGLDAARADPLRDVVGGTGKLMEIFSDPEILAAKTPNAGTMSGRTAASQAAMAAGRLSNKEQVRFQIMDVLERKYANALPDHIQEPYFLEGLAEIIAKTPDDVLKEGFYKHPLEAILDYALSHAKRARAADAQIEMMGRAAKVPGGERITLDELFAPKPIGGGKWGVNIGMRKYWRPDDLRNPMSGGAYPEFIKRFGTPEMKQRATYLKDMWDEGKRLGNADMVDAAEKEMADIFEKVGQTSIPKSVADDIFRWDKKSASPESINDLLKWWDSLTNMFKAGVLTAPARYVRDLVSGQVQNVLFRQFSAHAANDAMRFLRTGELLNPKQYLKDLPKAKLAAMSDKEAMRFLKARIRALGFLSESRMQRAQIGATNQPIIQDTLASMMETMPRTEDFGLRSAFGQLKEKDIRKWAPWNIRGVGFKRAPRETTENPFFKAGDIVGNTTDAMNRLVPFLELSRRGVAPNEIMRRIAKTQVEYGGKAFTNFEKQIAQRLVPFWKYAKSMAPTVAEELLDTPAGRMAQMVRGASRMTAGQDVFVPDYIRQTMAVPLSGPLGAKDEETQRYLTGLGLMHEDPLNLMRPGQTALDTVGGTLQELLGRMNPILKGAIEIGTGKQLYTGRELKTLDSPTGRLISNLGITKEPPRVSPLLDQLLMNSMFSRLLSTARQVTDTRKGPAAKALSTLTGVKIHDVERKKARNIAIRSEIEKRLLGTKGVRSLRPHLYVKESERQYLDPIDLMLMDMYRQQRVEHMKARRK